MKAELILEKEFPFQYRCCQFADGNPLLYLAGGLDPITGPRSTFHATATCLDAQGNVVWKDDRSQDKPYSKLLVGASTILLVIQDNFNRRPTGIHALDSATGQLQSTRELRVEDAVAVGQDIALVAEAYQGDSALHLLWFDDLREIGKAAVGSYQDSAGRVVCRLSGSALERRTSEGTDCFCVTFRCGEGKSLRYEHEFRKSLEGDPDFVASDANHPDCAMLEDYAVLTRIGADTTALRVIGISNPSVDRPVRVTEHGGLYAVIPFSQSQVLCSFHSGVIGLVDIHDGTRQDVIEVKHNPDWRALSVSEHQGLVAVLDTYNHNAPMSRLSLISLSM